MKSPLERLSPVERKRLLAKVYKPAIKAKVVDVHSVAAKKLDISYDRAKAVNLGVLYGTKLPPFEATKPMLARLPELKPCRFCRKKMGSLRTGLPSLGFWVHCMNTDCFAGGPRKQSHLEAVKAWNK